MEILVLIGLHNIGKTTTIDLVHQMVLGAGGISTNRVDDPFHPGDFSDIVHYNGKKVAFYSLGDYSTFLANAIYDYANQNCDILVCACSMNRAMVRANIALNSFVTRQINKTVTQNISAESTVNNADALVIFGMI